jgi:hypothetical protein
MKILLLAHEKDDHAAPVQWALTQAGYEAACWSGVSPQEQEQASLFFNQQPQVLLGMHALERGDTVWLRQTDEPALHPATAEAQQFSSFSEITAYMLEALPARCINRLSASRLVRNKAVQLHLASQSGLRVPAARMSNAPAAVREFFDANPDTLICKPFAPHVWQQQDSGEIAVAGTFSLNREELPSDEVLTYAPAIYQKKVSKQFDVRTVLMGRCVYSFALHTPGNALDWRFDGAMRHLEVEMIATPRDVENGLLLFAQKAGICFGSADFAVDQNGQWWFLEINEQGQFLWLDEFCPRAALQQKFCAFLTVEEETPESLEATQGGFTSIADYNRAHPQRERRNITKSGPEASYKSMER